MCATLAASRSMTHYEISSFAPLGTARGYVYSLGVPLTFLPRSEVRPLLVAHRGLATDGAGENTLAAYEQALQAGADAIECDLRLTHDSELVVYHDREVDVGGSLKPVIELDEHVRAELSISAFDDVRRLMEHWPDRGIVLDIKTAKAADAFFAACEPSSTVMIISFSDLVVTRATDLGWSAAFIEGFLPMILRDLTPAGAYFSPSLGNVPSYPELLSDDELRRSLVGTVDDVDRACGLAARGVFGMTTNRVDVLRRALPAAGR
jgi:glycerophosphoryl diester phosphodiesterase